MSDSDPVADGLLRHWRSLAVEEAGGFAGLRRGAVMRREQVDRPTAEHVASLLAALGPPSEAAVAPPSTPAPVPDAQGLVLQAWCEGDVCLVWGFDRADLPAAAEELLAMAPPFKPLPRG